MNTFWRFCRQNKFYFKPGCFFLVLFFLFHLPPEAEAQGLDCPKFKGSAPRLNGWYGRIGEKTASVEGIVLNPAKITLTGRESTPSITNNCQSMNLPDNTPHRFKIYDKTMGNNGMDVNLDCYNLPVVPNDNFDYSIRLGNTCGDHEAEALYYDLNVTEDNALIFVHYAIVLENPGHTDSQNPEFIISVKKGDNLVDPCAKLRISSYNIENNPEWGTCGFVAYKNWTKVALNLSKYLNETVTLEIMTGDCSFSAHYGYAYVALECMPMKLNANDCAPGESDTIAVIDAPSIENAGYKWRIVDENNAAYNITGSRGNQSTLHILKNDFNLFQNEGIIDFVCEITTYMNPKIPCKADLNVKVTNLKPRIGMTPDILCGQKVVFENNSFVSSVMGEIDTTKSYWEIEDSIYHTHSQVSHIFSSGGVKKISLYAANLVKDISKPVCYNKQTFTIRVLDSIFPVITTDKPFYCIGDTASLTASGADSYVWTVNGRTFTGNPIRCLLDSFDTEVKLSGIVKDCSADTSLKLTIQPYPNIFISGDSVICSGLSVSLTASADMDCSFSWSTSPSGLPVISSGAECSMTPSSDTVLFITVSSVDNCISNDSLQIKIIRPVITAAATVCSGDRIVLSAAAYEATHFSWRADPPDPDLTPAGMYNNTLIVYPEKNTDYFVSATGPGPVFCRTEEAIQKITIYPYPVPDLSVIPDFIDSEEPAVILSDNSLFGVYSLWDLGDGTSSDKKYLSHLYNDQALLQDSITIVLSSFNELGCTKSASVTLPVEKLLISFPNAFTPNNGDKFFPSSKNTLEDYHLTIYNRWGELVFESSDYAKGWDGLFKGTKASAGTYVWHVVFKMPEKIRVYSQKGNVLLIR